MDVLYYGLVKEHRRPTEKAPSLVQRKKVRGLCAKILIFYEIFYFCKDFGDPATDVGLIHTIFIGKLRLCLAFVIMSKDQFFFILR